jgi:hypothetical protein
VTELHANQVVTELHANQGHCYANQVVAESHANQGHLFKTGQIHTEIRVQAVAQLRKGRKKEYSEKMDKGQETQVSSR